MYFHVHANKEIRLGRGGQEEKAESLVTEGSQWGWRRHGLGSEEGGQGQVWIFREVMPSQREEDSNEQAMPKPFGGSSYTILISTQIMN